MIPSLIERIHARRSARDMASVVPSGTAVAEDMLCAPAATRRAQSAIVLPVAAPLAPHLRAGAALEPDQLRDIDPRATCPSALATLLLPSMQQARASATLTVKHLIERVRGARLQTLKTHLERQAPGALMNFVFQRCHPTMRQELLAHFRREAPADPEMPYILSDIDNTVCPSRDPRYPKSTPTYPGRAALWRCVLGEADADDRTCFLSARFGNAVLPWQLLSRHERKVTFANLARVGITQPKILFGSVLDMPYPSLRGINMSPLGAKKIKNFEMLRQVFPEYRYVFFGDTCEDDLHVGEVMLQTAPDNMGAVFIHDFGKAGQAWTPSRRQAAEALGVIFYKTAPGAALAAYQRGLFGLTPEKLQAIASEATGELQAITFETEAQQNAAAALLQSDLQAIDAALSAAA